MWRASHIEIQKQSKLPGTVQDAPLKEANQSRTCLVFPTLLPPHPPTFVVFPRKTMATLDQHLMTDSNQSVRLHCFPFQSCGGLLQATCRCPVFGAVELNPARWNPNVRSAAVISNVIKPKRWSMDLKLPLLSNLLLIILPQACWLNSLDTVEIRWGWGRQWRRSRNWTKVVVVHPKTNYDK